MEQLLLHLWGDYVVQSHWMAIHKKEKSWKGHIACQLHCLLYTLPFLLITQSSWAIFTIYVTHFIIDRGNIIQWFMSTKWKGTFGQAPFAPWSTFLIDNILHITINFLTIKYNA
jgi:hypothetical protein